MLTWIEIIGALVILVATMAVLAFAWRGASELIIVPHRVATSSPADYGLAFENVAFSTRGGLTLRGWFIPAENPQGTIIVCHGYTGECSPDLVYAPMFNHNHFNTLYFDFRGHGMSDGHYTSLVYFERYDVLAALDHLKSRGIERVALLGLSMGGAIALATASLSPQIVGVASDCAFAELWRVVEHRATVRGVSSFLASWIGRLVILIASIRLRVNLFSADPIHWVSRIAPRPLLLMHAADDDDAPVENARRLFAAAREPKELWVVPNAKHREIEVVAPEEYRRRVSDFFQRVFTVSN